MTPNFTCRAVQDHVSAKMMRIQQVQGRQVVIEDAKSHNALSEADIAAIT